MHAKGKTGEKLKLKALVYVPSKVKLEQKKDLFAATTCSSLQNLSFVTELLLPSPEDVPDREQRYILSHMKSGLSPLQRPDNKSRSRKNSRFYHFKEARTNDRCDRRKDPLFHTLLPATKEGNPKAEWISRAKFLFRP
ncbi:hypothetical protein BHE74_00040933 [Ensete ventricosum]|nr:hypothetical protein GW17_00036768 [Ensete ventricosum]RWW52640.1 hypothetical protein BHE74_00040933 [Ensete ventricosum]RZS21512.1 hypothetical protein BHM03_00054166 [Ensete ventricosum]